MNQVISIGKQDFASLREGNYFFVDKPRISLVNGGNQVMTLR